MCGFGHGIKSLGALMFKDTVMHRGEDFVCLCWGLTSQSTIFQSCRDGATASWVINQYFRGVKCLVQGHNTAAVGFEPPTSRSGVRHSTTEPPRSPPWGRCWGQIPALESHYPQPHGMPGLQMTCVKRGLLFISRHSCIKKRKKEKNLGKN